MYAQCRSSFVKNSEMREFVRILLICVELILIAAQSGVGHDPSPTNRSSNGK